MQVNTRPVVSHTTGDWNCYSQEVWQWTQASVAKQSATRPGKAEPAACA